jgi:hypothetical protein
MSISDPQSFNRYAYVGNDPMNLVDPSGLNASQCSAEFSYEQCGGDDGFWGRGGEAARGGGGWGDGFAVYGGMSEAELAYEGRLQTTRDAIAAQNAWNAGDYSRVSDILNGNPNIGLSVDGVRLWGELGAAFANGYGERIEIASLSMQGIGSRLQRGWEATARFLKALRPADFLILNVTASAAGVGVSMSRAVPHGDSLYDALTNPMKGAGLGSGGEISFAFGWLLQRRQPSHSEIESWLSGQSLTVSGFYKVGGGFVYAPNSTPHWAVIGGFGIGGKGVGASYMQR